MTLEMNLEEMLWSSYMTSCKIHSDKPTYNLQSECPSVEVLEILPKIVVALDMIIWRRSSNSTMSLYYDIYGANPTKLDLILLFQTE